MSCDPIYGFSAKDISERIEETRAGVMRGVYENADAFVWTHAGSPDELEDARMSAMRRFLDDFPAVLEEGRYVVGGLPDLPFESDSFDLSLCSHLLFTYSSQLSLEFHLASLLEMCRVAREARVSPLLLRQGSDVVPIPGIRRRERQEENAGAVDVELTECDLASIEEVAPKGSAGERHPDSMMGSLDR